MATTEVLDKLEWPGLLREVADRSQTEQGRARLEKWGPNLSREQVRSRWNDVVPLKKLCEQGYYPPIGFIPELKGIFRALAIAQILDGVHLRDIATLLKSVKFVHGFATDFSLKAPMLSKWRADLYPLPKLLQEIDRAITPEGEVFDEASKELDQIRRHKRHLMQRILDKIKLQLAENDVSQYLQDDFFTIRNEKYVIPIRVDGRGRVEGQIIDVSSSGQTLFIEPPSVVAFNQQLADVELSERLEVIRILKELSSFASKELDHLKANMELLLDLDVLSAQARLAAEWKWEAAQISSTPCLKLYGARHPLLKPSEGLVIANDILLNDDQSLLVISGPNAGGKTVSLKTTGLIHLMAKAGFLLPLESHSELYLFENVFLEMGDGQSLSANLSTFSSHLAGLKPILENCKAGDLVLLDEIAVGTEPNAGAAIAQAVVEELLLRSPISMVTTHYERLKTLALNDSRLRNGSMEYAIQKYTPTYKLILDVPGQSYGLELAQKTGLPSRVISRAKDLRGENVNQMEFAISELLQAKIAADQIRKDFEAKLFEADVEKARWTQEVELLKESRKQSVEKVTELYGSELEKHRSRVEQATMDLKHAAKEAGNTSKGVLEKAMAKNALSDFKVALATNPEIRELPGLEVGPGTLCVGDKVFVIPLGKNGNIIKISDSQKEIFEILVGIVKVRASHEELRLIQKLSPPKPKDAVKQKSLTTASSQDKLVFQTASNTCNLRGLSGDDAVARSLKFIDNLVLKGEEAAVLVHGLGTSAVKHALRKELKESCAYPIYFRPGQPEEGGDAVTIVFIKD